MRVNPFCDAFKKMDDAVAAKQAYETKQIKQVFHSKKAKANMDKAVADTEAERSPLAAAIANAMGPVRHSIAIRPVQ